MSEVDLCYLQLDAPSGASAQVSPHSGLPQDLYRCPFPCKARLGAYIQAVFTSLTSHAHRAFLEYPGHRLLRLG